MSEPSTPLARLDQWINSMSMDRKRPARDSELLQLLIDCRAYITFQLREAASPPPTSSELLKAFDLSVAGVRLHDSPRPNYEHYDKAEWHTRGISAGLKIARTILEQNLKPLASPPPTSPTVQEASRKVSEIVLTICPDTQTMHDLLAAINALRDADKRAFTPPTDPTEK